MSRPKQKTPFLLTAASRTLSLKNIYKGGEEKAYETFKQMRWPVTNGKPVCPKCDCAEAYEIKTRRRFECKACKKNFSVTSGTIFASRKMSFVDLMAAICIIVNGAKGLSAVQLSRDLDCQHKTAFVLAHKIREAMAAELKGQTLSGDVEIDGAYFGGHIRPANLASERVDRRLAKHQTGKRRVVIAIRQRTGRTLTFVRKQEAEGVDLVSKHVCEKSRVHADEAGHWDALHARFETLRINHQEAYSLNGVCTNQAESYFSRLRRMVSGQHHFTSPRHLHAYAAHAAWKEDHRRESNGAQATRIMRLAMTHGVSRQWKRYWQRGAA